MKTIKSLLVVFILGIMMTNLSSCERIDAGHVGLRVSMTGDDKGVSDVVVCTGWQYYLPWATEIVEWATFVRTKDYTPFEISVKGGSSFVIDPTMSYRVLADKAPYIYQKFRVPLEQIEDGYIRTIMYNVYKDAAAGYTPDSLISNKAKFENDVEITLREVLGKEGFYLENITSGTLPPEGLRKAIADKEAAVQKALTLENEIKQAKAAAEKQIAQARGQAESLLTNARAEAESNRLRQQTLTPMLIQQQWIEAWKATGGNVPTTILGGNSPYILNLGK